MGSRFFNDVAEVVRNPGGVKSCSTMVCAQVKTKSSDEIQKRPQMKKRNADCTDESSGNGEPKKQKEGSF